MSMNLDDTRDALIKRLESIYSTAEDNPEVVEGGARSTKSLSEHFSYFELSEEKEPNQVVKVTFVEPLIHRTKRRY